MPPFPPCLVVPLILVISPSLFFNFVSESAIVILNFELISPSSQNLGLAAILTSSSFPGSPISLAFS